MSQAVAGPGAAAAAPMPWTRIGALLAGAAAAAAVFRLTHPEPAIVPLVAEGDGQPA
jgi:hypothetical protein